MADYPPPTIGHDLVAQLNISKPVGDIQPDGSRSPNTFDDTLVVQYLLNRSPGPGKPNPPLQEDGAVTARVIAAIRDYESSRGVVDGRIDPGDSTMVALNAIALSEFEGITDLFERRSIILRVNPQWNFTRGDFKTLTDMAGLSLRFDPSTVWLPNVLKDRFLTVFNLLLNPAQVPSSTWGVSSLDWSHSHLGLWSGVPNKPVSAASTAWVDAAVEMRREFDKDRRPFIVFHGIPAENVALYTAAYNARLLTPDVAILLNSYADLPEAVIVHHTFEAPDWRPTTENRDPRRNWMVDAKGEIQTPPYRTPDDLDAAQNRDEFHCEGTIEINFLIDKSGVIHPVLGGPLELCTVTGLASDALLSPPNRFKDVRIPF